MTSDVKPSENIRQTMRREVRQVSGVWGQVLRPF